jgi:hypothetical protein
MFEAKKAGFSDRLATQAEAKKALLAKFKPKAAAPDPNFVPRDVIRANELEAVRAARAEAKEAMRQKQLEAEEAELAAKRADRKERKALTKAEQKAKRDARYAARQARRRG